MKLTSILLFLLSIGLLPVQEKELKTSGNLQLKLKNIEHLEGCIRVAIFPDKSSFDLKVNSQLGVVKRVEKLGQLDITLDSIPFGSYAIAIYHDQNDNDQLDKNLWGIPTEPYAFSNNPKVKWKAPSYEEVQFEFKKNWQVLDVALKKWKKQ